jgi:hypothetical protein
VVCNLGATAPQRAGTMAPPNSFSFYFVFWYNISITIKLTNMSHSSESSVGELPEKQVISAKAEEPTKHADNITSAQDKKPESEHNVPFKAEKPESEKEIKTAADAINFFEEAAEKEKDGSEKKNKIIRQIDKIKLALGAAGLSAANVNISEMSSGELGLYDKNSNHLEFSEIVLEDMNVSAEKLKDYAVLASIQKKGILDEGLARLLAEKKVGEMSGGGNEKAAVRKLASLGVSVEEQAAKYKSNTLLYKIVDAGLKVRFKGKNSELEKFKRLKSEPKNWLEKVRNLVADPNDAIRQKVYNDETEKIMNDLGKLFGKAFPEKKKQLEGRVSMTAVIKTGIMKIVDKN